VDRDEDDRPAIVTASADHIISELARAANFYRYVDERRTAVPPPRIAAQDLLALPVLDLGFPALVSVAEAPFLRPDGSLCTEPGYDRTTRTYHAPRGNLSSFHVPDEPMSADVAEARELIFELLHDFPFVLDDPSKASREACRANAVALLLTPVLRPALGEALIPLCAIDSPQMGTGKGLLSALAGEIAIGSSAVRPVIVKNDEEWRKALTSTFRAGRLIQVLDNLEGELRSPVLAAAITSTAWEDRLLGTNDMATFPNRCVFIANGNNIRVAGDLVRRTYWIRMDAQSAQPWRNREFLHPELIPWVRENRGRLLATLLTMARAWFVAGTPVPTTPKLGSFEQWTTMVGGILETAGIEGFLGNLDAFYESIDPSVAAWESFLLAIYDHQPSGGFKTAELVELLRKYDELKAAMPDDLPPLDDKQINKKLGMALAARCDRRYGERGIRVTKKSFAGAVSVWIVQTN
jgi:hypothetical protein